MYVHAIVFVVYDGCAVMTLNASLHHIYNWKDADSVVDGSWEMG